MRCARFWFAVRTVDAHLETAWRRLWLLYLFERAFFDAL